MLHFINARIFAEEGKIIENGYISIHNGKITALGDMNRFFNDDEETVDIGGRSIYPGFIDAHTHLGMWEDGIGFEGDDGNEKSDPVTPHLRAVDAVNSFDRCFEEAAAAGVTAVLTCPGSANAICGQAVCIKTSQGRVDDLIVKAPVAMKMALGENPKTVHSECEEAPYTRMATAAMIREQLFLAQRYAEDIEEAEHDEDASRPDFDMKLEALLPVIRGELPVHFHAHRRDDIFTAIRIAEEFSLKYVIVHGTEGHLCADILARLETPVLAGPFLCDRPKPEMRELTPKNPGILANAGVMTAIITDHPETPIQYLPMCAGLAMREGMCRDDGLAAITSVPAKILGVYDRIGSLEVGKDADFSVFSGDPLSIGCKPDMVYINGVREA